MSSFCDLTASSETTAEQIRQNVSQNDRYSFDSLDEALEQLRQGVVDQRRRQVAQAIRYRRDRVTGVAQQDRATVPQLRAR